MSEPTGRWLGKYRILEEIGRGGFGIVYRAVDTHLPRRTVALKVLHPQLVADPTVARLFAEEANTAAGLEHPNIVTIWGAGTHEERRYIAMKCLTGPSLDGVLEQEGPQPLERVADWVQQVAAALDYAHAQGIVHRDLKPSNLVLDADPLAADGWRVVITDFGLARAVHTSGGVKSDGDSSTSTAGTVRYKAPEQWRGKAVPQSDQYALGIVAYELLTGRVPFSEGDAPAIGYQHIYEPPPPLRQYRPDLPAQVEEAVLRALAKEPAERYASSGAFGRALTEAVEAAAREERSRQQRVVLLDKLAACEAAEDWAGAAQSAALIDARWPGYGDVPARLEAARSREAERLRAQELEEMYTGLKAALAAGDWPAAVQAGARLQEKMPGYRDVDSLLAGARAEWDRTDAERERANRLAILYDTLVERGQAGDWVPVIGLAAQIEAEAPGYRDVARRRAAAEAHLRENAAREKRERDLRDGRRRLRWAAVLRAAQAAGLILAAVGVLVLALAWGIPAFVDWMDARATAAVARATQAAVAVATEPAPITTAQGGGPPAATDPTVSPTPSPTPAPTSTPTPSATPTSSTTPTPSPTDTPTPTATHTPTLTDPVTPSATPTKPTRTPTPPPAVSPAPQPPPPAGRIAFSVVEAGTGTYMLYDVNPDGSGLRGLGNDLRQPSYRQDGELLVANGQGGGRNDLWELKLDGTRTRAFGHLDDEHPVWVQGGSYSVAFDSLRWGDGRWRIYLGDAPVDSGRGHVLGQYPVALPGAALAYKGCDYWDSGSNCGLYRVPAWGGTPTRILAEPHAIPTGAGGDAVLYLFQAEGNWDVYLVGVGGGAPRRLTEHPARDGPAAFSPDGQSIAFLSDRSGTWALWLMGRDGTNQRKVLDLPQGGNYGESWFSERIAWGAPPQRALPTATPIPECGLPAPVLVLPEPPYAEIGITHPTPVRWTWSGSLGPNQAFEVRFWHAEDRGPKGVTRTTDREVLVDFRYTDAFRAHKYTTYSLDVVVIQLDPLRTLSCSQKMAVKVVEGK